MKRIVLIGGTSAIAEHCARLWLKEHPAHLILVGRDPDRLKRVKSDLQVRSPEADVQTIKADFIDPESIDKTVGHIFTYGKVDIVLIAHGSLPEQHSCQSDLTNCSNALVVNGVSLALYAEAFAKHMEQENYGTIALIGSVAGDRGRKSNYVYGAAKGMVTRYAQGLQHRFAGSGVKVILIKPGPTDTPMTSSFKSRGATLAPVQSVAKLIVDGIEAGKPLIYAPRKWGLIMMVIRHIPSFIFNKTNI